ncbi:MAG: DUF3298 and DUF4163 domain-containing protein [Lachnospiraceae bacterium]|nr:DUF3298 and DUF4163 domain-containing protein [Lachnospiraceae bacterium]
MKKTGKCTALLMLCLCLAGCGTLDVPVADSQQREESETASNATAETEETTDTEGSLSESMESGFEAEEETEENVQVQGGMPEITVIPQSGEWYDGEDGTLLLEYSYGRIVVAGEGTEALQAALDEQFPEMQYNDRVKELVKDVRAVYQEQKENGPDTFYTYFFDDNAMITRFDEKILSFKTSQYEYTGGAHGMYFNSGTTYEVATGALLGPDDILADRMGFETEAAVYIAKELNAVYGDQLFEDYETTVTEGLKGNDWNWCLDATGIRVMYTPYEIGPYAMGAPEVLLPYAIFGRYMKEEYLCIYDEMIAAITPDADMSEAVGTSDFMTIQSGTTEWDMSEYSLVSGDVAVELGEFDWLESAYLLKKDSRSFVLLSFDYMSDDYVTFSYEVTDGQIVKRGGVPGAYISGEHWSDSHVGMVLSLNVLGTYGAKLTYIIDEMGQLMPEKEMYIIDSAANIKVKKQLPVMINGESVTLEPGTEIRITGTNNIDEVLFKEVSGGREGVIHYTMDEENSWIHLIDGISEYEYFEELPYAG